MCCIDKQRSVSSGTACKGMAHCQPCDIVSRGTSLDLISHPLGEGEDNTCLAKLTWGLSTRILYLNNYSLDTSSVGAS